MNNGFRFLGLAGAVATFAAAANLAGCTTDAADPGATGGTAATSGGASNAGSSAGGATSSAKGGSNAGGSTSPSGTVCASPVTIPKTSAAIASFDTYDGSDVTKWSFTWGADTSIGVYAGSFGYGDRDNGFPETFEMATGHDSKYAMRIADSNSVKYGGGSGVWLSACLKATQFAGISFWVRGSTPSGMSTFTLSMGETTTATPAKAGDAIGTCTGTSTTCVHPTFAFPVTDTWTQIQAPWTGFKAGDAAGTTVTPDGRDITQIQWGVGLNWVPDASGTYAPVASPYELELDDITFY